MALAGQVPVAAGMTAAHAANGNALKTGATQQQPVVWRLVSDFPEVLEAPRVGIETFIRTVNELADGRMRIEHKAATQSSKRGAVAQSVQALEAVQGKEAEIAYTMPAFHADTSPVFAFSGGLPFGPNARQFDAWLSQGRGLDLLNEAYKAHGIHALPGGNTGALMGGWYRREIVSAQDFQGLKIAATGLSATMLQARGVIVQSLPPQAMAAALEKGEIEGALWNGPHDDELLGLNKAAPFYYYPGWLGGSPSFFYIRLSSWEALEKPLQTVCTVAALAAQRAVQAHYDAANPPAIKRVVATGARLRPFPQPVLESLFVAAREGAEKLSAEDTAFRTLYDSIRIFRDQSYLWWQVAEYPYDNFQIRLRGR